MSNLKAIDVAKWFIKSDLDEPRNSYDGNMKLQKLLFFSQLIHLARFNEPLFNEEMKAYKNGSVVNEVRWAYKELSPVLIQHSIQTNFEFDEEVNETLRLTVDIFGELSAKELSDLNHELASWKSHYYSSITDRPGVYDNYYNGIDLEGEYLNEDVNKIRQMLEAYDKGNNHTNEDFEVINGVTFYYNPSEIELTEDILAELGNIDCPDEAYTLTYDESQGIILL